MAASEKTDKNGTFHPRAKIPGFQHIILFLNTLFTLMNNNVEQKLIFLLKQKLYTVAITIQNMLTENNGTWNFLFCIQ